MRNYVLGEVIILIKQVLIRKLYMYLTNIERRTKAGNCPTCRSVNFYEGPIQLKGPPCGTTITRTPEKQPDYQLPFELNDNLETSYSISENFVIIYD